ncbi:MAG: NAD-dependent epimerase/dehydratase family protein [Candidatus Nealsonbacteria bacterium]
MKILITGSSGLIGSALKDFLEKQDVEVILYDLKDNPPNDTRNFSDLKEKMSGADGVVHLAAVSRVIAAFNDPLECINTNVGGTINVLEAARVGNRPWVIFGSSREVFGESRPLPVTEETPCHPMNVYGIAKIAGEDLCKIFSRDYGLKTRTLRFSNVYTGPRDQLDRVIPKFILQAAKNEDIIINGTGEELFDFTYLQDTIQGIWGCIQEIQKSQKPYDDFILATGVPTSLRELADLIIKILSSKSEIKHTRGRSYDVNKFYADPAKARQILGFDPKTGLKEGIIKAIQEFKEEKII